MRVISGKARHLKLKTLEGLDTRPTTDRTKETLFNIIQNRVFDSFFLDLFSGSGAIGIEALSRGASVAYFVENNRKAVDIIKDNLAFTKLVENAKIIPFSADKAINAIEKDGVSFDLVFMDPPYNKLLEKTILEVLRNSSIINNDTLIIIEASIETEFDYLEELGFVMTKEKKYKTNKHVFVKRIGE